MPDQRDISNPVCHYTFRDRYDRKMELRGDLTMDDLIRVGYQDIGLVEPEKPLGLHEWRCEGKKNDQAQARPAVEKANDE